jgi:hypothetical protein
MPIDKQIRSPEIRDSSKDTTLSRSHQDENIALQIFGIMHRIMHVDAVPSIPWTFIRIS